MFVNKQRLQLNCYIIENIGQYHHHTLKQNVYLLDSLTIYIYK